MPTMEAVTVLSNIALVAWCRSKIGCGYVFGSTGQVITEAFLQAKAAKYPSQYTAGYLAASRRWIGRVAYDCGGLIDAFLGVDKSADGYYHEASAKGVISTLPEAPGVLVFMARSDGTMYHVGVCVGGGSVIEARGVAYGVVETALAGRRWTHWGKCSLIDYSQEERDVIQKGDKGTTVKSWQEALLKLGFELPKYGADADFGGETETATKSMQARFSLPQTGIVDAATAVKAMDALRLLPGDVSGYQKQIGELTLQLEQARNEAAKANSDATAATGDLKSLAAIIKKYEV